MGNSLSLKVRVRGGYDEITDPKAWFEEAFEDEQAFA